MEESTEVVDAAGPAGEIKRKRGRPRKYPASSAVKPNGPKRGRGRPPGSTKKKKIESIKKMPAEGSVGRGGRPLGSSDKAKSEGGVQITDKPPGSLKKEKDDSVNKVTAEEGVPARVRPLRSTNKEKAAAETLAAAARSARGAAASKAAPQAQEIGLIPLLLHVPPGQDIGAAVRTAAKAVDLAACVLSATGSVTAATIRGPGEEQGNYTWRGPLAIVTLSGCFLPSHGIGGEATGEPVGDLSVSLADVAGQLRGGVLCGPLVAAGLVQIVLGTFPIEKRGGLQSLPVARPF